MGRALTLLIVLLGAGCGSNKAPAGRSVGIASERMAMMADSAPGLAIASSA